MSLSVIVLAVAMAMLINSTNAQKQVNGATAAASSGQLIMGSVQAGVRNASHVQLTGAGTQLLMVRTAGGQSPVQWACQAWYFTTAGGGTLYTKRILASASATALPMAGPTASTLSSWTLLGTGISVSGAQIFIASAGLVTVSLTIDTGKATPITLKSTSNTLTLVTTGAPPCV
jgi:hypothetical protein